MGESSARALTDAMVHEEGDHRFAIADGSIEAPIQGPGQGHRLGQQILARFGPRGPGLDTRGHKQVDDLVHDPGRRDKFTQPAPGAAGMPGFLLEFTLGGLEGILPRFQGARGNLPKAAAQRRAVVVQKADGLDRKSTRLNSSHT